MLFADQIADFISVDRCFLPILTRYILLCFHHLFRQRFCLFTIQMLINRPTEPVNPNSIKQNNCQPKAFRLPNRRFDFANLFDIVLIFQPDTRHSVSASFYNNRRHISIKEIINKRKPPVVARRRLFFTFVIPNDIKPIFLLQKNKLLLQVETKH